MVVTPRRVVKNDVRHINTSAMCRGEVTRFCPENRGIPRENRGKRLLCGVDARHLFKRRKQSRSLLCRSPEGQESAAHAHVNRDSKTAMKSRNRFRPLPACRAARGFRRPAPSDDTSGSQPTVSPSVNESASWPTRSDCCSAVDCRSERRSLLRGGRHGKAVATSRQIAGARGEIATRGWRSQNAIGDWALMPAGRCQQSAFMDGCDGDGRSELAVPA